MAKQQYRIRNWKDDNQALVSRGSLTVWTDESVHQQGYASAEDGSGKRRPMVSSDSEHSDLDELAP